MTNNHKNKFEINLFPAQTMMFSLSFSWLMTKQFGGFYAVGLQYPRQMTQPCKVYK